MATRHWVPISRDKRYIALSRPRSTSDATSSCRSPEPHDEECHRARRRGEQCPADFVPDGTQLLYTSNAGREFASVRSISVTDVYVKDGVSGRLGRGGDLLQTAVPDGPVNHGCPRRPRVLDAATFHPRRSAGCRRDRSTRSRLRVMIRRWRLRKLTAVSLISVRRRI